MRNDLLAEQRHAMSLSVMAANVAVAAYLYVALYLYDHTIIGGYVAATQLSGFTEFFCFPVLLAVIGVIVFEIARKTGLALASDVRESRESWQPMLRDFVRGGMAMSISASLLSMLSIWLGQTLESVQLVAVAAMIFILVLASQFPMLLCLFVAASVMATGRIRQRAMA